MRIDAIFGAIGRFAVGFRWLVVLAWVIAAIAAATQLPALSSVTQSNNTKFLPASAPSEHAAVLAAPFGTAGLIADPGGGGAYRHTAHSGRRDGAGRARRSG